MLKQKMFLPICSLILSGILFTACGKSSPATSGAVASSAVTTTTGIGISTTYTGNMMVFNNPSSTIYTCVNLFGSCGPTDLTGAIAVEAGDTLIVDNRGDSLSYNLNGAVSSIPGNGVFKVQLATAGWVDIYSPNSKYKVYGIAVERCLNSGVPFLCTQ